GIGTAVVGRHVPEELCWTRTLNIPFESCPDHHIVARREPHARGGQALELGPEGHLSSCWVSRRAVQSLAGPLRPALWRVTSVAGPMSSITWPRLGLKMMNCSGVAPGPDALMRTKPPSMKRCSPVS